VRHCISHHLQTDQLAPIKRTYSAASYQNFPLHALPPLRKQIESSIASSSSSSSKEANIITADLRTPSPSSFHPPLFFFLFV
jgi:hypothetical protein